MDCVKNREEDFNLHENDSGTTTFSKNLHGKNPRDSQSDDDEPAKKKQMGKGIGEFPICHYII